MPKRWVEYLSNGVSDYAYINRLLENVKRNSTGGNLGFAKDFVLQKVGWNHDYFTNALPTPTLFGEVKLPILDMNDGEGELDIDGSKLFIGQKINNPSNVSGVQNYDKLGTVRDLRKAIAVQHYLEKLQVSGGQYKETLKTFWNQHTQNNELQMSEYLGGSVIPLFVNEIEATASSTTNALGDLAGKPLGAGRFDDVYMQADEFGVYMCIAHIVPKEVTEMLCTVHTLQPMLWISQIQNLRI